MNRRLVFSFIVWSSFVFAEEGEDLFFDEPFFEQISQDSAENNRGEELIYPDIVSTREWEPQYGVPLEGPMAIEATSIQPIPNNSVSIQDYNDPYNTLLNQKPETPPPTSYIEPEATPQPSEAPREPALAPPPQTEAVSPPQLETESEPAVTFPAQPDMSREPGPAAPYYMEPWDGKTKAEQWITPDQAPTVQSEAQTVPTPSSQAEVQTKPVPPSQTGAQTAPTPAVQGEVQTAPPPSSQTAPVSPAQTEAQIAPAPSSQADAQTAPTPPASQGEGESPPVRTFPAKPNMSYGPGSRPNTMEPWNGRTEAQQWGGEELDCDEPSSSEEAKKLCTKKDSVFVERFRITGASLFQTRVLQQLVAPYAGQELTLDELEDVAYVITRAYCQCGFILARAYLPEQDIVDGVVEIAVIEPAIDRPIVEFCGCVRLTKRAVCYYLQNVSCGQAINQGCLEEALIVLNDLPGVCAQFFLSPGAEKGTSSLIVKVREKPVVTGSLEVDNYGNRYTGYNQVGARINVNDLTGYGDQIAAQAIVTGKYLQSGRLSAVMPVNSRGTKAGVSASYTVYNLAGVFTISQAVGHAAIYSAFVTDPLYLRECLSLYTFADLDYRNIKDYLQTSVSRKKMEVLEVGINGNSTDSWRGVNAFSGSISLGNLSSTPTGNATDPFNYDAIGFFTKLSLTGTRLQCLYDQWSLYLAFTGQIANRHLDGTEEMYLGGPYAVRAYPTGEAPGDFAAIATIEGRYTLYPTQLNCSGWFDELILKAFVDGGSSTITNANPELLINNTRNLAGAGLGFTLTKREFMLFDLAWSHKIAGLPAQSNGKNSTEQLWVKIEAKF